MVVPAIRTDAEIERDIKDALHADVRLNSENMEVGVRDCVVFLRGFVPNRTQRVIARELADRIKGVCLVVNKLSVAPLRHRSDAEITADVAAALAVDSLVDEDRIEVSTVDSVVYLRGTVNSHVERKAAYEDARAVPGVLDLINELLVAPSLARSDPDIAAEVRRELDKNLKIDMRVVKVDVRHGVANLTGKVATQEQRWLVDELVRWVPGVINVVNTLRVAVQQD